jgi:GAF domain-containing protein
MRACCFNLLQSEPCVNTVNSNLSQLENLLATEGLHAGLKFLNERVPHRFTAVYRLDELMLRMVDMVDKDGLNDMNLEAVPLGDSFCQFTLRDGSFITTRSADDQRLNGHPYQGVMESYIGLPLARADGELFGTFCHFDLAGRPVNDEEYAFLTQVAAVLPRYL